MKTAIWVRLLMLAVVLTTVSAWGAPCPPATAVSVTISPTYTFGGTTTASAISPDSSSAYSNGVDGVSAIINGCTHDVVLDLGKSTRSVGLSLQSAVATNTYTPAWTATPFSARAHIVVSNLLYAYSAGLYYQFTTTANITFTAPDGNSDQLQFVNPAAQTSSVGGGLNQPYTTSLVVVTHTPADPSTGAVETWTVTPDNAEMNPAAPPSATQVAGLLVPAGRNKSANGGQFSMPFQFSITRK